jgi:hypothetical protein
MGASMFVYRGIEGAARDAGAPERTAEIAGLVGTGIAFGSWRPMVKKILNPVQAAKFITTGEKALATGGLAYMVIDGVPALAEAVYNTFDDAASVRAREEWYAAVNERYISRGLFGSVQDVPWYERAWNTLNHAAGFFVPASLQKAAGIIERSISGRK